MRARFKIFQQIDPPTPRPFQVVETVDTKDGPRSRLCSGMFATEAEARASLEQSAESFVR